VAEPARFRSSSTRFVGLGAMSFAALGTGSLLLAREWDDLVRFVGPLGLIGLVGYAALWLPYVDVTDGGVELRNVFRTVRLPWPAIQDVDGRYGLRLATSYGRFTAWAAPAPGGRDRFRGNESEAAELVRMHLDRLTGMGHLANPRLEHNEADVSWHLLVVAVGAALMVITVLGPLLS
jgi:hypothetical protein